MFYIHHLYKQKHTEYNLQLSDDTDCTLYSTGTCMYSLLIHTSQPCTGKEPIFINSPKSLIC